MLLFTLLFTLSGPSPKSRIASAPRCCLFSHSFGLLLFSVYSTVTSNSCFLHHYLHFPNAVMSDKWRKTPVALILQQRAEILRLCDQQVQWFMDCFVFICSTLQHRMPPMTLRQVMFVVHWKPSNLLQPDIFSVLLQWKLWWSWKFASRMQKLTACAEMNLNFQFNNFN